MERELTKEKKHELLNIYSSNNTIIFVGFLTGVSLLLGTIFLLLVLSPILKQNLLQNLKSTTGIYFIVFLLLTNIIAARLSKIEYEKSHKYHLVYFWFVLLIFIYLMIYVGNLFIKGELLDFAKSLEFGDEIRGISVTFWFSIILTALFCSFVFANPLKQIWSWFYNFYLEKISEVDYITIYNERYFYNQLRQSVYNARRYKIHFSTILFKIENFSSLFKIYPKRTLSKIENYVLKNIRKNIRETDIAGFLGKGEFYGIVLFTTTENSHTVASRIKNFILEGIEKEIKQFEIQLELSFNIWPFPAGSEETDIEMFIKKVVYPNKKEEIPIIKM